CSPNTTRSPNASAFDIIDLQPAAAHPIYPPASELAVFVIPSSFVIRHSSFVIHRVIVRAMTFFGVRISLLFFISALPAFAGTSVVNLSHYDLMRVDFEGMKREGVIGV